MPKVALISGGHLSSMQQSVDRIVGVDRACLWLLNQGYQLDMAVGDFDSVSEAEKTFIKSNCRIFIEAPSEKDDTDTELAIQEIAKRWPEDEILIYGGFGGRLDHELSNLFLPSHPSIYPIMSKISLRDEQNLVTFYPQGHHIISKKTEMTYVSFMLEGQGNLEILGAKYPLTEHNYFARKMYSSNEFQDSPISVKVPDGYLIVIESQDKE